MNARDPKTLTVRQVMENAVYTVSPHTKGIAIAETMTEGNFGAVPVVEKDFTLVGLLSEFDLLRIMEEEKDLRKITAEKIMTRNVVTVTEEMLVKDLVHLLQERHLIRVSVVQGKALVGIASRRDIVFGYVKATAEYWWPGREVRNYIVTRRIASVSRLSSLFLFRFFQQTSFAKFPDRLLIGAGAKDPLEPTLARVYQTAM